MSSSNMSVIDLSETLADFSRQQGRLAAATELPVIDLSETVADSSLDSDTGELEELEEELEELAEVATEEEEEVVVEVPTEGEGVVLTEDEEEDYSYDEDEMPELEDVDVSTVEEEAAVDVTGPVEEEVRALLAAEGAAAAGHALRRMEALLGRWGHAALETPPRGVVTPPRGEVTPPRGVVTPPRSVVTPPRGEGAELGDEMVLDTTIDLTDSPNTNQGASPLPSGPLASLTCPVCLDTLAAVTRRGGRVVSTRCGHVFCGSCLPRCIQTTGQCPTCRTRLTLFGGFHPLYLALN